MESESEYFARNLSDPEKDPNTRGFFPVRLRRPPYMAKGVEESGFDVVRLRDLPMWLRDRMRETLKLAGPKRLAYELRHYHTVLSQAKQPLMDQGNLTYFAKLVDRIENALPDQKGDIFKNDVEPFFKSLQPGREGETDGE